MTIGFVIDAVDWKSRWQVAQILPADVFFQTLLSSVFHLINYPSTDILGLPPPPPSNKVICLIQELPKFVIFTVFIQITQGIGNLRY